MASDFTGSFDEDTARLGYHSRLSSQRFDSSIDYASEYQSKMEGCFEEDSLRHGGGYVEAEGSVFSGEAPILPPPAEEGFPLREWRRKNDIRLVEKERKEREMLKVIIEEADAYKAEFYRRWKIRSENIKSVSREREKLFVEGREKFHAEAEKSYWNAVSQLIPKEIPVIEKKGNKEKEKRPAIVVIQGPKPGKPTDLSRVRQLLLKLKHEPPVHMVHPVDLPSTSTNQGVPAIAK